MSEAVTEAEMVSEPDVELLPDADTDCEIDFEMFCVPEGDTDDDTDVVNELDADDVRVAFIVDEAEGVADPVTLPVLL